MAILSIAACANHSPLPKVIKLPKMTNSLGQTMVQLPEGEFRMGHPEHRKPVHQLKVSSFWIASTAAYLLDLELSFFMGGQL